jgi:LPS-assembly lipoprotein
MVLNFKLSEYRTKLLKQFLLFVLCVSLVNCGFKLRGAYELPAAMQVTYIDHLQVNSDLVRALKIALKASDIKVADTKTDDVAVLRLHKETRDKRTVSVDSQGRAREYTLTYALRFSVIAGQQNFEIAEQVIRIERDFIFDPEDVLGNSRGESQLYEEMQQDLVRLLLLRLQSKA